MTKLLVILLGTILIGIFACSRGPTTSTPPLGQGTISGTVMRHTDGGDCPIPYVIIHAFQPNNDWPVIEAHTDSLGHYIMQVMFGDYQVRARTTDYIELWYNNVSKRSQATILTISSRNNPTGIDFLLQYEVPPPDTSTCKVIEGVVHLKLMGCPNPYPYVAIEDTVQSRNYKIVELHSDYFSFVEGVRYRISGTFTDTVQCDLMDIGFHVISRDSL